mmetsp:Transcript_5766/g.11440  ORF Transcript_5766/g.11440 Transcript_5766/m.11440 type:complete len:146 (-) Transcript_5766:711-1148(-)
MKTAMGIPIYSHEGFHNIKYMMESLTMWLFQNMDSRVHRISSSTASARCNQSAIIEAASFHSLSSMISSDVPERITGFVSHQAAVSLREIGSSMGLPLTPITRTFSPYSEARCLESATKQNIPFFHIDVEAKPVSSASFAVGVGE